MLDWWSYIGVGGIAFQGLFLDVGLVGLILFSSLDPCYGALVSHGVSYCFSRMRHTLSSSVVGFLICPSGWWTCPSGFRIKPSLVRRTNPASDLFGWSISASVSKTEFCKSEKSNEVDLRVKFALGVSPVGVRPVGRVGLVVFVGSPF